jgi:hypothetical protein
MPAMNGVKLRGNEHFELPTEHFIGAEAEEFRRPAIE